MFVKVKFIQLLGILLFYIFQYACIEPYNLDDEISFQRKIVVYALITDTGEEQSIRISYSTSINEVNFSPVSGCSVMILGKNENEYIFKESQDTPGEYLGYIDPGSLNNGKEFKLLFTTPGGDQYSSNFEEYTTCPPVDSVYFDIQNKPTNDPEIVEEGVQFYMDLVGDSNDSRHFYWTVDETWEYHSMWPIMEYLDYDGWHDIPFPFDSSVYYCYKTLPINDIYTLSTSRLNQNIYKKYKLHFVNDHTQRLMHKYSLLIKQYSVSENIYNYWEKLKKNSSETGLSLGSQPIAVEGNIKNISDAEEKVLGFFGVSSIKTKRIIINSIKDLSFLNVPYCTISTGPVPPDPRPLYFVTVYDVELDKMTRGFLDNSYCIVCTMKGGTTEKPEYWNNPTIN